MYSDANSIVFTNETAKSLITLKRDNASGADIEFAATAVVSGNAAYRRITINPAAALPDGDVYVAVGNGYFDAAGNQGAGANATFTVDTSTPSVPPPVVSPPPVLDPPGLTVSPSALFINEGATGTFTVRLATLPSGDVTVTLASDNSDVTLDDSSLLFTPGTWNTEQTVTVTAGEDDDYVQDTANVTLDPSGGDYDGVADVTLVVTVEDDDTDTTPPTVTFLPEDGAITNEAYGDIWLTFDELTYSDAGATPFTNNTAASLVTLTQTDASGEAIQFTARAHLTGETAHRRITITPMEKPLPEGAIHVAVSGGYYDAAGNQGSAASATFTVDTVAPTVSGFSPADGAVIGESGGDLTVDFSERVYGDTSGTVFTNATAQSLITLKRDNASGADIAFSATAVVSGDAAYRRITITPDAALADGDVYIAVGNDYYDAAGNRGERANATFTVYTAPPPVLSVADAEVDEAAGAELAFAVSLDRAVTRGDGTVSVDYATRDVTAHAGADYTAASGTLTFAVGERAKTVNVTVLEDAHDDDGETLELVLSNPVGAGINDGTGTGTIRGSDSIPQAWLGRFGRSLSVQVLGGVHQRREAARAPGEEKVTLGGHPMSFAGAAECGTFSATPDEAVAISEDQALPMFGDADATGAAASDMAACGTFAAAPGASADVLADATGWYAFDPHALNLHDGAVDPYGPGRHESYTLAGRDLLLGASFALTGEADEAGGTVAGWGRVARSRFEGREGTLTLDGTLTTGLVGADYAREDWLAGVMVTWTDAKGDYHAVTATEQGELDAELLAGTVYGSIQAAQRLELWGAAGYGEGELKLTLPTGPGSKTDMDWTMAAAGARGALLEPGADGGLMLALVADALWTRTTSEQALGLESAEADVTQLRLGLEGGWSLSLGGGELAPTVELGLRHDGGDAETGLGVELGGGLTWRHLGLGLAFDVQGRTLVTHEEDGVEDRGFSAGIAFDSDPLTDRGPSLTLRHEYGGAATGGLDALFAPDALATRSGTEASRRWAAQAAWGLPAFRERFTGSPHLGLGLHDTGRDLAIGWRLAPAGANAPDLSFDVKAIRLENANATPDHGLELNLKAQW